MLVFTPRAVFSAHDGRLANESEWWTDFCCATSSSNNAASANRAVPTGRDVEGVSLGVCVDYAWKYWGGLSYRHAVSNYSVRSDCYTGATHQLGRATGWLVGRSRDPAERIPEQNDSRSGAPADGIAVGHRSFLRRCCGRSSVSYTHLTLPTIYSV